jgi:hypothetical protein
MSSSGPPSPDNILNRSDIEDGTFGGIARLGFRGALYGLFLFVISIITGFVDIVQTLLGEISGSVVTVFGSFFGGVGDLITAGAARTTESFILPAGLGWVEGLFWVIAGVWVVQQAMAQFSTDIFFIPGADIIPFFGNEQDGAEDDE